MAALFEICKCCLGRQKEAKQVEYRGRDGDLAEESGGGKLGGDCAVGSDGYDVETRSLEAGPGPRGPRGPRVQGAAQCPCRTWPDLHMMQQGRAGKVKA